MFDRYFQAPRLESGAAGEPVPVEKGPGDEVTGGTQNGTGTFRFRVTRVGGDTLVAQIIRLVEEAQGSKAPIQRLVDQVGVEHRRGGQRDGRAVHRRQAHRGVRDFVRRLYEQGRATGKIADFFGMPLYEYRKDLNGRKR